MKRLITLTLVLCVLTMMPAAAKKAKEPVDNKKQYINLEWWERYNDPVLNGHVQTLYQKNHDLKIAALKVQEGEKASEMLSGGDLP